MIGRKNITESASGKNELSGMMRDAAIAAIIAAPLAASILILGHSALRSEHIEQKRVILVGDTVTCAPNQNGLYLGPSGYTANQTGVNASNYVPPCSNSPALNGGTGVTPPALPNHNFTYSPDVPLYRPDTPHTVLNQQTEHPSVGTPPSGWMMSAGVAVVIVGGVALLVKMTEV